MKAITFDRVGEPQEVLRLGNAPEPQAHGEELRVRVIARPIHPADLSFIRGQYRIRPSFPQVAGLEGVGIVLEHRATGAVAPGTRVAFRWPGTWAEIAAVPTHRLISVPNDVSDAAACQFSLNPLTAWALLDETEVRPGEWLLMTAGASTVSNLVAAVARARGVHTIGLVRGAAETAVLRTSADRVLSVDDPQLLAKISEAASGGVASLLDSVGGPITARLFPALQPGARIVAYGVQDRAPIPVTNAMLVYANLTWKGFGIDRWLSARAPDELTRIVASLWSLIRQDALPLPVDSTFPLCDFREALAADARPTRCGKILLT